MAKKKTEEIEDEIIVEDEVAETEPEEIIENTFEEESVEEELTPEFIEENSSVVNNEPVEDESIIEEPTIEQFTELTEEPEEEPIQKPEEPIIEEKIDRTGPGYDYKVYAKVDEDGNILSYQGRKDSSPAEDEVEFNPDWNGDTGYNVHTDFKDGIRTAR
jgi:hypothetical protein